MIILVTTVTETVDGPSKTNKHYKNGNNICPSVLLETFIHVASINKDNDIIIYVYLKEK